MAKKRTKKAHATKRTIAKSVWGPSGSRFKVTQGKLVRGRGRPSKVESLFKVIGEKLPFESLENVRGHVGELGFSRYGVYVAHDSMGYARYVGRGAIFSRLKSHRKAHPELLYYSFYIVAEKAHEREIETVAIRAAGPQLHFNTRKRRIDIGAGNVRDFEAGTFFYERKGKRQVSRRRTT
jgi:hypothetical protein